MGQNLVIISHGEKGGVGKSMIASLIIEACQERCYIAECDHSAPDVARRYRRHGYRGTSFALLAADTASDAVGDLMSDIEAHPEEPVIVVNLPASAGQVVDAFSAEIRDVCDALGRDLVVAYAIGASFDSISSVRASLKNGLAEKATRRVAVFNQYFGNPARFGWDQELSKEWSGRETILPALSDRVTAAIREIDAPYRMIADGVAGRLPLIDRALLRRWLLDCRPMVEAVYGD